jgi:hypothetical protein
MESFFLFLSTNIIVFWTVSFATFRGLVRSKILPRRKLDIMKTKWIIIVFCMASLTACVPSAHAVNTATPFPTNTPSPSATPTATLLPSPTPDVRVIDIDPRNLLLQKLDLPANGKYYLPGESWISPLTNSEILSSWTVEDGQAYLAETGQIHGWRTAYRRGTNSVRVPEEVYDNVVIYSNIEGAQIVVTKYGDRDLIEDGYKEIEAPQIGDVSRAFRKEETNSSGATRVWLRLMFSYRNMYHVVELRGWLADVPMQFAVDVANKLLEGLKQLPLSETVTFTP